MNILTLSFMDNQQSSSLALELTQAIDEKYLPKSTTEDSSNTIIE